MKLQLGALACLTLLAACNGTPRPVATTLAKAGYTHIESKLISDMGSNACGIDALYVFKSNEGRGQVCLSTKGVARIMTTYTD
jgi:hypothetical protein